MVHYPTLCYGYLSWRHPIYPYLQTRVCNKLFPTTHLLCWLRICQDLRSNDIRSHPLLASNLDATKQVGHHWCEKTTLFWFPACYNFFSSIVENSPIVISNLLVSSPGCTCTTVLCQPTLHLGPQESLHSYVAEEAAGRSRAHGLGSCEQCCLNPVFT